MRAGANYDRVIANLSRLLAMQSWPTRKVVVAMIIGKSNVLDLGYNLRFAMELNLRLMVNPITQYPPTEKLTLFADFDTQTQGWDAALADCEELLQDARRQRHTSLDGLDPSGAIRELRNLYETNKRDHADVIELTVEVDDPNESLGRMRCPGLMVCDLNGGPYDAICYVEISRGQGTYVLRLPRSRFVSPMRYAFYSDLFEIGTEYHPPCRVVDPAEGDVIYRSFKVPDYRATYRPKNIHYLKRRTQGLEVDERIAVYNAYLSLAERERAEGFGYLEQRQPEVPANELAAVETMVLNEATAAAAPPHSDTQLDAVAQDGPVFDASVVSGGATDPQPNFVIDFCRPFTPLTYRDLDLPDTVPTVPTDDHGIAHY